MDRFRWQLEARDRASAVAVERDFGVGAVDTDLSLSFPIDDKCHGPFQFDYVEKRVRLKDVVVDELKKADAKVGEGGDTSLVMAREFGRMKVGEYPQGCFEKEDVVYEFVPRKLTFYMKTELPRLEKHRAVADCGMDGDGYESRDTVAHGLAKSVREKKILGDEAAVVAPEEETQATTMTTTTTEAPTYEAVKSVSASENESWDNNFSLPSEGDVDVEEGMSVYISAVVASVINGQLSFYAYVLIASTVLATYCMVRRLQPSWLCRKRPKPVDSAVSEEEDDHYNDEELGKKGEDYVIE